MILSTIKYGDETLASIKTWDFLIVWMSSNCSRRSYIMKWNTKALNILFLSSMKIEHHCCFWPAYVRSTSAAGCFCVCIFCCRRNCCSALIASPSDPARMMVDFFLCSLFIWSYSKESKWSWNIVLRILYHNLYLVSVRYIHVHELCI